MSTPFGWTYSCRSVPRSTNFLLRPQTSIMYFIVTRNFTLWAKPSLVSREDYFAYNNNYIRYVDIVNNNRQLLSTAGLANNYFLMSPSPTNTLLRNAMSVGFAHSTGNHVRITMSSIFHSVSQLNITITYFVMMSTHVSWTTESHWDMPQPSTLFSSSEEAINMLEQGNAQ
uniref:Uncharacterized protein n=1 Tax=Rhizophagus irregularis (strain DAOM 181602 / DAOM 197198 / MUCL 43194) TaxID=747089 RepID=U9T0X1_RHIID